MPQKVQEAEKSEENSSDGAEFATATDDTPKMTDTQLERMDVAVARWTEQGGYRKNGLKKSVVAEQMGVSENQLTLWLRQHDTKFADRPDLQKKFKKNTGMTPVQYAGQGE